MVEPAPRSGLLDALLAALNEFAASRPQQDDVTLLNIDYHGTG